MFTLFLTCGSRLGKQAVPAEEDITEEVDDSENGVADRNEFPSLRLLSSRFAPALHTLEKPALA